MKKVKKEKTMKTSKILTLTAVALTLSINNFAISATWPKSNNIAVVDVQKIIESSPEITALKIDGKNKLNDLASFAEKARAEVAKETNATNKKTLEDSYNKELNIRKVALDQEYTKKLSDIDKNITSIIKTKAKSSGYSLVLVKSSVIDGGTDITNEIIKDLK